MEILIKAQEVADIVIPFMFKFTVIVIIPFYLGLIWRAINKQNKWLMDEDEIDSIGNN